MTQSGENSTDANVERQRKGWEKEHRFKHLEFAGRCSFHTSRTFMDYLHGDVADGQAEVACKYEYARELPMIWKAAKRRDQLRTKGLPGWKRKPWEKLNPAERNAKAACWAFEECELQEQTPLPFETLKFLVCESFPEKDWNDLPETDRRDMARYLSENATTLPITDVWTLKGLGVIKQFEALAERAKPLVEDHDPQRGKFARPYVPVLPIIRKSESVSYAVFTIDYTKGETRLIREFKEWLRLPENQNHLANCRRLETGKTGKALDRLKDLAAWRLYRECGNDWNKANDFANRHRKKFTSGQIRERFKTKKQRSKYRHGTPRPFRDAKKQDGKPPNEAELFGEAADPLKAHAAAWKHLVEFAPNQFAPPGPSTLKALADFDNLTTP